MDAVQAPIVAVIGQMIGETPGTISLGQGVVHYGPPAAALDAVREALATRAVHEYQGGLGIPALVEAITAKLAADNRIGVAATGSEIMVTAGANMAFVHALLAVTAPGDEVILPVPFYFNHEMAIEMIGCRPVAVPTDDRYQLRLDAIERALTSRTRAIVTISPNNPTGAVLSEESLRAVSRLCGERGLFHVSDETYEYFTYGSARHVSPASFDGAAGHTISLFSLSKAYGFAGWRIGYAVYPGQLSAPMIKAQDTILICPPVASQVAAAAALGVGRAYCAPYVSAIAEVREIVVRELGALAPLVTLPTADGAFYCLLRIDDAVYARGLAQPTPLTPLAIAERLIREHRVAVIPGTAFGITEGGYFRVAYGALQKDTVAEGVGRLVRGLTAILGGR